MRPGWFETVFAQGLMSLEYVNLYFVHLRHFPVYPIQCLGKLVHHHIRVYMVHAFSVAAGTALFVARDAVLLSLNNQVFTSIGRMPAGRRRAK